jgi:hypothetical protein
MSDHPSDGATCHWADERRDSGLVWGQLNALVNRIFGIGLVLESAASLAGGAPAARLHGVVEGLDVVVHDIRAAVFDLTARASSPLPSLPPARPVSALIAVAGDQMSAAWILAMVDEQLGGDAAQRLIREIRTLSTDTGSLDRDRTPAADANGTSMSATS